MFRKSMARSSNSASARCAPSSGVSRCFLHSGHHLIAVILTFALLRIPILQAQQPKISEYQVKATYLYNFGRFVHWPASAAAVKDDSFPICVLGQDPFGTTLDSTL